MSYIFLVLFFLSSCSGDTNQVLPTEPKPQTESRIIGGDLVDPNDSTYKPVIRIHTGSTGCSATVIGPHVAITASHCGRTGATTKFKVGSDSYSGKFTRSKLYPKKDHDIALIKFSPEWKLTGNYAILDSKGINIKDTVKILGYGCTKPGGGGPSGTLRIGESTYVNDSNYDMVSYRSDGAGLCYGDSGGATIRADKTKLYLVGVNSKGNIKNRNYSARVWSVTSQNMFKEYAQKENVKMCGVNFECDSGEVPVKFTLENDEVLVVVTDKPGGHNTDYIRTYFKMLMDFLVSK